MNGGWTMTRPDQTTTTGRRTARPAPSGFTLVELLVVIAILAMLAALVTTAGLRGMSAARNARIKAEIDMLHTAIMNYKNEYGTYPPSSDATSYASTGPAARHLGRLFPRCSNPTGTGANAQFAGASTLVPANALKAWLAGFTNDPTSPLLPSNSRQKLYAFDNARFDTNQLVYYANGKPGSPFIYIQVADYGPSWPSSAVTYTVGSSSPTGYTIPANAYFAQPANGTYVNTGPYANPDSFQILCAGQDETFGTDDDMSNFGPGTRKDYLDSL